MRPEHVRSDEVSYHNGLLSSFIEVTRKNRSEEEIGYEPDQEARVEAALSHRHNTTTFSLISQGQDVASVLELADADFQFEWKLKEKYRDTEWRGHHTDDMCWEGQKSIMVGRCDGEVVSIACLDVRFISDNQASKTRYLSIGVGPFFVPKHLRGRAHCIEMSISVACLCAVLQQALYLQLPRHGILGVSIFPDYPGDTESSKVHPFLMQIYDKIETVQQMLACGYLARLNNKHPTITFLPVSIER
jgi:hypothetical protein